MFAIKNYLKRQQQRRKLVVYILVSSMLALRTSSNILTWLRSTNHSIVKRYVHTPVKKSKNRYKAYLLTSESIYDNLAFENWLYTNKNFDGENLLLLWRSKPCIVIGRHQNPWVECDVHRANHEHIDIARRYSGGGTVYHDLGNLNCSFFTSRADYDRTKNSQSIVDALKKNWDLDVGVASVRDDIFLESFYKISGSSSKLGPSVAYHHCTLLFNVDKDRLSSVLHTDCMGMKSNATESVRSRVKNLSEVHADINFESLTKAIAELYLEQGLEENNHLEIVDPTDENGYPGVSEMSKELKTWSMIYGRTPKFSIRRTFSQVNGVHNFNFHIDVEKGVVTSFKITADQNLDGGIQTLLTFFELQILGAEFLLEKIETFLSKSHSVEEINQDFILWLKECIQRLFTLR